MQASVFSALALLLASASEQAPLGLSCKFDDGEGKGAGFSLLIAIGTDRVLTLLRPNGSLDLDYWYDGAPGEMETDDGTESMTWTKISGSNAPLVGFGVRSDGSIFTLSIRSPDQRSRKFELYDSRIGVFRTGACR